MNRYEAVVRRVAAAYRLQDADAADAVQNTWVRAVERLHTIRDPEQLGGWLVTTARRECLAQLRRRVSEVQVDKTVQDEWIDSRPGPEALVLHDEMRRTVRAAVERLPPNQRRLVGALFSDDVADYAALARETRIPIGSIGPTRQRALAQLRTCLKLGDQRLHST